MPAGPAERDARPSLFDALAPAHLQVLALRAAGVPNRDVATLVGVPVESVDVLVGVASQKVWRVIEWTRNAGATRDAGFGILDEQWEPTDGG